MLVDLLFKNLVEPKKLFFRWQSHRVLLVFGQVGQGLCRLHSGFAAQQGGQSLDTTTTGDGHLR